MALLETVDLTQKYGERPVLRNIDLKVERGEVFALIGPTGAGKTTLLRLLDLLETPSSGRIYFDGVDVTGPSPRQLEIRRRMAFVQQKPVVFNASVYDNVACALRWRREKGSRVEQKVSRVLERVELSSYRSRNARTLSGGEMQRVAIARALVTHPELLLLDEPTANLDPVSSVKIEALISKVIKEDGITIVMATHDMAQGQRLATRTGVLMGGELWQKGNFSEIFNAPQTREIAEFVGVENIIGGVVKANEDGVVHIDAGGKTIEAISGFPVGTSVYACVRPENVTLTLAEPHSSARNFFAGEIRRLVSVGVLSHVEMDCGFPLVALITKKSAEELKLDVRVRVYASFKATGVHVIKQ